MLQRRAGYSVVAGGGDGDEISFAAGSVGVWKHGERLERKKEGKKEA
jgi:hypothetical protein